MTEGETKVLIKLLRDGAERLSGANCSDFSLTELVSDEEAKEIVRQVHINNNEPDEFEEASTNYNYLPDWYLMYYLAEKIERESKDE